MQKEWKKFFIAPSTLRERMTGMIRDCIEKHSEEHPARIIMSMNALVDPDMIQELYQASIKGIKIDLIIRGICCLRPGIKGLSENITVKSIVGRFLEHTRVYYFKAAGKSSIYLGSADLMQRNLNRRVELVFPIEDPQIKHRVRGIIQHMLDDTVKSRYLNAKGEWLRPEKMGENRFSVQEYLLAQSQEKQQEIDTIGA